MIAELNFNQPSVQNLTNREFKQRIAFIAHTRKPKLFRHDPSFIYRCENLGLSLQAQGHEVHYLHWTQLRPTMHFDVIVFHRPRYSTLWYALFCWLQRQAITLVADVDDLIFDPKLAHYSPGVVNALVSLAQTKQQFSNNYRALACFEQLTVSTQPLAHHIKTCLPVANVQILPNAVHHSWRNLSIAPTAPPLIINYFSGTRSHDRDFAVYAQALTAFLKAHSQAQLHITGPLNCTLKARHGQIIAHEKRPFADYAPRVRHGWLNLAPLEHTPFTACKSALKVIEAGYWNIPTLCSSLPDAQRFAQSGAVFADDGNDCLQALEALLNPDTYAKLTHNLSARVLQQADIETVRALFLQFIAIESPH